MGTIPRQLDGEFHTLAEKCRKKSLQTLRSHERVAEVFIEKVPAATVYALAVLDRAQQSVEQLLDPRSFPWNLPPRGDHPVELLHPQLVNGGGLGCDVHTWVGSPPHHLIQISGSPNFNEPSSHSRKLLASFVSQRIATSHLTCSFYA